MRYKHTQVGYRMVVTMGGLAALIAWRNGSAALFGLMCFVMGAAMTLFGSLTTTIDGATVLVQFGPIRLIRKRSQSVTPATRFDRGYPTTESGYGGSHCRLRRDHAAGTTLSIRRWC